MERVEEAEVGASRTASLTPGLALVRAVGTSGFLIQGSVLWWQHIAGTQEGLRISCFGHP